MPICPKCGSSNIHADKKGFSVKKSLAGGFLFGAVGLLGGAIGSNKIRLTCLDCGCVFNPGEEASNETDRIMAHYQPIGAIQEAQPIVNRSKSSNSQKVKIETLLKYSNVIKESKVELLEALLSEGHTYVVIPAGEMEILAKLQKEGSTIKRIVSFKEYSDK